MIIAITAYLPMSLATKKMAQRYRKHSVAQPAASNGVPIPLGPLNQAEEEVIDLFSRDRAL